MEKKTNWPGSRIVAASSCTEQEPLMSNEAFKTTSDGRAVPKWVQRLSGLRAPDVIRNNIASLAGFKDYVTDVTRKP